MARGYQLLDLSLSDFRELNNDQRAQILSWIIGRIRQLTDVPPGVGFEVIPTQYIGPPYPAIGLYDEGSGKTSNELRRLGVDLMYQLLPYVRREGPATLAKAAEGESITWQEVLARHPGLGRPVEPGH